MQISRSNVQPRHVFPAATCEWLLMSRRQPAGHTTSLLVCNPPKPSSHHPSAASVHQTPSLATPAFRSFHFFFFCISSAVRMASLTPGERFLSPSEDLSLSLSARAAPPPSTFPHPLPLPTSAELSAKAGHLLRHLLWLEVCLLSELIQLELPSQGACRAFLTTGRDKPRWKGEETNLKCSVT